MLFELLDVNGYLLIIEPGNPYGSHTVRTGACEERVGGLYR